MQQIVNASDSRMPWTPDSSPRPLIDTLPSDNLLPRQNERSITPQPQSTLLSALPRELRDIIWSMTVSTTKPTLINPSYHPISPPLLSTCRQTRTEAAKPFYSNNTFHFRLHDQMPRTPVTWLQSLPPECLPCLQHVRIELVAAPEALALHRRDYSSSEFSYAQMRALCANLGLPLRMERYVDVEWWSAFAEAMERVEVDHERVTYVVGEEDAMFRKWLEERCRLLEEMRVRWVKAKGAEAGR